MIETKYKGVYVDGEDVYYRLKSGGFRPYCKWVDNVGYYTVSIPDRALGVKKYVRVHRLLAETFIDNPNSFPMVNHKDGNKLNNNLLNLEWCTNSHNTQDAYNKGLYKSTYRCEVKAKFLDGSVQCFRSIRECARELGVNRKTLTSILKGLKSNNYPFEISYV